MTATPAPRDPEEIIGYMDENGDLIPIQNFTGPNALFQGQPVPEAYVIVRERDINDDDWHVTI